MGNDEGMQGVAAICSDKIIIFWMLFDFNALKMPSCFKVIFKCQEQKPGYEIILRLGLCMNIFCQALKYVLQKCIFVN